ncbi:T-complex protein 1 subunit zeta-like [Limulus polyphemus]|uniref:T-complex protein 1 subunit zeta-like n=1 Tax=Limulus polyphemus TaxID=6850 RepID=A0ABM1TAX3_LIMPO|nr:T-complex protein 1 subunit zeta-like [Limulus polyphemus]
MAAVSYVNPKAEIARHAQALSVNISAARGLQDVLKTNLGPKGTMKMLVSGAGDIKITKDGNVLLHEMQIQHPTASLIARASTAQNDISGDGTTSTVLVIGELLKQADLYISEGLHPRLITEGLDLAKNKALEVLENIKVIKEMDRDTLLSVARTSLRTKVHHDLADRLTEVCVDAVLSVKQEGSSLDLHMIEIIEMMHKTEHDSTLIKGLVLDHGARHPDMKKYVKDAYILTCNVSFEYEKRYLLPVSEKLNLQEHICFISFLMFVESGNCLYRLALACGGTAVNSVEDLTPECLGTAGLVYEHVLGENKYTFIEELQNPHSVTILLKGPNKHSLTQMKDAVHDGLRAVKNAIEDGSIVPGAGAYEIAAHAALSKYKMEVKGRAQLGVQAYADALLVIPKVLASNAGYDSQETMVKLIQEHNNVGQLVGLDINSGEALVAADAGIFDNFRVKRQLINSCTVIASNLLLVDEIMRAGLSSTKGK